MQTLKISPAMPGVDALAASPFYRLVRDSLMLVLNMNRGMPTPSIEVLARQRRWVQGKLVEGAANDPSLSLEQRQALIEFHVKTLRDHFEDRRGAQRRKSTSLPEARHNG